MIGVMIGDFAGRRFELSADLPIIISGARCAVAYTISALRALLMEWQAVKLIRSLNSDIYYSEV